MKRIVIVDVTEKRLRELLQLPDDARIVDAQRPFDRHGVVSFLVETPQAPLVGETEAIQHVDHGDHQWGRG